MNRQKVRYNLKLKKRILKENGYSETSQNTGKSIFNHRLSKHVGFIGYYYNEKDKRLHYSSMKEEKKRLKKLAAKKYRRQKFSLEDIGGKSNIRKKFFPLYWELY